MPLPLSTNVHHFPLQQTAAMAIVPAGTTRMRFVSPLACWFKYDANSGERAEIPGGPDNTGLGSACLPANTPMEREVEAGKRFSAVVAEPALEGLTYAGLATIEWI